MTSVGVARHPATEKTVVHIVTGALGAGKTTFIRKLILGLGEKQTGIVINEFASGGIDQLLVADRAEPVDALFGCICCKDGGDVIRALETVRDGLGSEPALRRILIEMSGLAIPQFLIGELSSDLRFLRAFRLGSVVATVDLTCILRLETPEYANQVRASDAIVLTNADRVYTPELALAVDTARRTIHALNPSANICRIDEPIEALLPVFSDDAKGSTTSDLIPVSETGHVYRHRAGTIRSASFRIEGSLTWSACHEIGAALSCLGRGTLRIKMLCPLRDGQGAALINLTDGQMQSVERLAGFDLDEIHVYVICEAEVMDSVDQFIRFQCG